MSEKLHKCVYIHDIQIILGTQVAFTYKKKSFHGTIARTNTEEHKTLLIDKLYNLSDLIANGAVFNKWAFQKSQIWKTSDLSNDDLLSDMSSYTDAMDFFDNLHNEKAS